ncbi:MAG: ArsR/SmtB family transcription factor [Acidimicrobiia bacterium]
MSSLVAAVSLDPGELCRAGSVLADATRCRILARLAEAPAYPADLAAALDTTRANVSNHLACLRLHGLVVGTPEGRRVRYRLANPSLGDALHRLVEAMGEGSGGP